MAAHKLKGLLAGAGLEPEVALVRLWRALTAPANHTWRNYAEGEWARNTEAYEDAREATLEWLEAGARKPFPRSIGDELALAAMEALDQWIDDRLRGSFAPIVHPVALEDPDETFQLLRRPRPGQAPFSRQPGVMQSWLAHSWIVPERIGGIEIRFAERLPRWDRRTRELVRESRMNVFVSGFRDGIEPDWQWPTGKGKEFFAEDLTDGAARWDAAQAALEEARERRAHVVVLPELTLTVTLRKRLVGWLADNTWPELCLVLPGSFHEVLDEEIDGTPVHVNACSLHDGLGRVLTEHRKMTRLGWKKSGGPELFEKTRPGRRLELFPSCLGPIATPICLDFCQKGAPFPELWRDLGTSVVLVPSMGDHTTTSAHADRAKDTWISHAQLTVVANQPLGRTDPPKGVSDWVFGLVRGTGKTETHTLSGALTGSPGWFGACFEVAWPAQVD